nr:hypothetical protein [Tanacetum cinerariifolium]
QNGIAERKNRTLIEAARTLLADLLLPIPFWAEAVNTACYVHNRVLVTKPHNKTPYELLHSRLPSIGFMRPFGCPVTILNTLDPLGKFQGKLNEGFLVGYSVCSKAFRVFNSRTRIVQETLHVNFMENKPNVAGASPAWLFDIDSLSQTMNYHPISAENQSNTHAGFQDTKKQERKEIKHMCFFLCYLMVLQILKTTRKMLLLMEKSMMMIFRSLCLLTFIPQAVVLKQGDKSENKDKGKSPVVTITGFRDLNEEFKECINNSSNGVNAASSSISAAGLNFTNSTNDFSAAGPSNAAMPNLEDLSHNADDVGAEADINNMESIISTISMARAVRDQGGISQMFNEDFHTCMFACFLSQEEPKRVHQALKDPSWIEAMQEELIQNKKDERGIVIRNKARLVAQGHTQEECIDYEEVFTPVARIEAIRLFLAYASFMGFPVYQMDVKSAFLYGTIEKEVYVCQPLRFEDPEYPDKVFKVVKAFYGLHQAPRACLVSIIEKLMKDKFQMSSMEELTFFLGLQLKQKKDGIFINQDKYVAEILRKFRLSEGKSTSTPIDAEKPLLKDSDGEDVDVHTYRSMIGSLMYLTSSRPDIMFADSPFDLVAYSDSDYAGASLDKKSSTGGCQFLGCRLISWQCKKQTVVATSSIEVEYVAAASGRAQVMWMQNQLLDYRD